MTTTATTLYQQPQQPNLTLKRVLLSKDALWRSHFVKVVRERRLGFEELGLELAEC